MHDRLQNFFANRNGMDQLSRALLWCMLIALILSWVFTNYYLTSILYGVALLLALLSYFRVFSRNLEKRRTENNRYLELTHALRRSREAKVRRRQQKKHFKFYKCPSCGITLRVPRGKGFVMITCRQCGASFQKKT